MSKSNENIKLHRNSTVYKQNGFSSTIKPFTAMLAGIRLLKNIEDTKQAFIIFDSIDGPQTERNFQRYKNLPEGKNQIDDQVDYNEILLDRTCLSTMSSDSIAARYLEFTDAENLNAEHLTTAERDANISTLNLDPSRRCFIGSGFALHDIMHIITGYGRDPIGEACVIAFTAEQLNLKGLSIIASAVCIKEQILHPTLPVMKAHREAKEIARNGAWLHGKDWRTYFSRPYDEVRHELRIGPTRVYNRLIRKLKSTERLETPSNTKFKNAA